jgi:hypothetical protein
VEKANKETNYRRHSPASCVAPPAQSLPIGTQRYGILQIQMNSAIYHQAHKLTTSHIDRCAVMEETISYRPCILIGSGRKITMNPSPRVNTARIRRGRSSLSM